MRKIFVFLFYCFIILNSKTDERLKNMAYPIVESAVDVAYWFFDKASDTRKPLDDYKMQQMLFLSQILFAQAYNQEMLFPSYFICDENGFFEPNIKKILAQGRPFMPRAHFDSRTSDFLEEVWMKFAAMTSDEIKVFILNSEIYNRFTRNAQKSLIDFKSIIEFLNKHASILQEPNASNQRKVLLSQNGPVMVSEWKPRKIIKTDITKGD